MSLSLSRSPVTTAATGDPHWNPGSNGMIRRERGEREVEAGGERERQRDRVCGCVGERRFVTETE